MLQKSPYNKTRVTVLSEFGLFSCYNAANWRTDSVRFCTHECSLKKEGAKMSIWKF
jgi:hypothetical protein